MSIFTVRATAPPKRGTTVQVRANGTWLRATVEYADAAWLKLRIGDVVMGLVRNGDKYVRRGKYTENKRT